MSVKWLSYNVFSILPNRQANHRTTGKHFTGDHLPNERKGHGATLSTLLAMEGGSIPLRYYCRPPYP